MAFLTWETNNEAGESLTQLDIAYGLPFEAENGYKMDQWDVVREFKEPTRFGFYKPEERLGKGMDQLMDSLMPGWTQHEEMPGEEVEVEELKVEEESDDDDEDDEDDEDDDDEGK